MTIPKYALTNFQINSDDDKASILMKRFFLENDRISRQMEAEQRLKDFTDKYGEIKRLKRNSKNTIDELKLMVAIEELLND